jgi:hypothetical protein
MPYLSGRVIGALGLARKGSVLGTFPLPLQSGHLASIAIPKTTFYFIFLLRL